MKWDIDYLECRLKSKDVTAQEVIEKCKSLERPFRAHPLGFLSCLLLSEGDRNARVHIWPAVTYKAQDQNTQIHDHIFNFQSWILYGTVKNIEKTISSDGEQYALYSTSYAQDKSIITKTENTLSLVTSREKIYHAGDTYFVSADKLHQTCRVGETAAITVLITENVSKKSPSVMGSVSGLQRYEYERTTISELELNEILFDIFQKSKKHTSASRF